MGSCMVSRGLLRRDITPMGGFATQPRADRKGGLMCLVMKPFRRKLDTRNGRVDLSHGSGGRAMAQLIADIFHDAFDNDWLRRNDDQASLDAQHGRLVMTTDGYVVSPLFFPGGDIGSLSVPWHDQRYRHGWRDAEISFREFHH